MFHSIRPRRVLAGVAVAALVAFWLPVVVAAHAELETSTPADAATVPSPFDGPIVMTFSAALADGSKAELYGSFGKLIATATIDGPDATMTIALNEPLTAATYEVKWVTVADDGDLERGTFSFTVAQAPTPTASPSPRPSVATPPPSSATAAAESSPPTTLAPSASPVASPGDSGAATSTSDVLLPIVVGLIVVGAGAVYLLGRRKRPTLS